MDKSDKPYTLFIPFRQYLLIDKFYVGTVSNMGRRGLPVPIKMVYRFPAVTAANHPSLFSRESTDALAYLVVYLRCKRNVPFKRTAMAFFPGCLHPASGVVFLMGRTTFDVHHPKRLPSLM
jgi:hypothetical protein